MTKSQTDLFIFAGEISADELGANLLIELKKNHPNLKIAGVGGKNMQKEKINLMMRTEEFLVMGFIDVLPALPKLIKNFFSLRKKILKLNPKVVLFIDYPTFNLAMQKSLRKKGFTNKLIQYVCPSIWAWKKKRKDQMEKHLDHLLTILPFEKVLFKTSGLPVHYVGHPLMKKKSFSSQKIAKKMVGLFPGSRVKEIKNNLPYQLKAAKMLIEKDTSISFALSVSD